MMVRPRAHASTGASRSGPRARSAGRDCNARTAMATQILTPARQPTMEEGKLAQWLVKEGQTVRAGDIIAEIETDKATMEVEAVDEGTVGRLLIEAGTEKVKVNTPIAVLLEDGESAAAAA